MAFDYGRLADTADEALGDLLRYLARAGYDFVTPTPVTHEIVIGRPQSKIRSTLADVLGWNFTFAPDAIDPTVLDLLRRANALTETGGGLRSLVRVAKADDTLFLHSGFPTTDSDAVFFGPDSYRFADLIARELGDLTLPDGALIADIGTGSGVGAIVAAKLHPSARIAATDINAGALRVAAINARAAGVEIECFMGSELAGVRDPIDVALANPPYIIDPAQRQYRDGGGSLGGDVSLGMARAAIDRLAPGGRLILYTGSAITGGTDPFKVEMQTIANAAGATLRYREIDPDVFNEELHGDAYADVERIAVVAAIVEMPVAKEG